MRQSQLFTKARREAPADEVAKNAQLLVRAGYIHKEMAGVYSYLPLGLRVLNKIVQIIREEMNAIGGQELVMSALQDKELWSRTDRWDDEKVDNWFKTSFKTGGETGLGITHEEPLTRIMTEHISSYRDLPVYAYQFQNKFRNEMRAKSGIMRGKEFLMKDLYSFSKNEEEHAAFFSQVRDAYFKIFERVGIADRTYVTSASGGIFSEDFSEEFQTICDAGEDITLVDEATRKAVNKEVATDEALQMLRLSRASLVEHKTVETGNIFNLGITFSKVLGLTFKNEKGEDIPVIMGSYGLGPTRLMGTLVEVFADEKGLVWPETVAPFAYHLVSLGHNDVVSQTADALYEELASKGVSVLYDDRDMSAGQKFAESDLLGIPKRIVVGKEATQTGIFELISRASGVIEKIERAELLNRFKRRTASDGGGTRPSTLDPRP